MSARMLYLQAAQLMAEQAENRAKESDQIFRQFDSNKDGTLDAGELRAGLEALLKQSVSAERAQQLLFALDLNKDGVSHHLEHQYTINKICPPIESTRLVQRSLAGAEQMRTF